MDEQSYALITPTELSKRVQRSTDALRKDRARNIGIPFIRIEGTVRYRVADVEAYLAANRVDTTEVTP